MRVEPAAWDPLLERLGCTDAYLRRDYVEACCLLEGGSPAFLHVAGEGGDVVFAAIVRPIPAASGLFDATTPYGYGGPVAVGSEAPVAEFWRAYERWCSERGVVSTFVRFHPLLANHECAPAGLAVAPLADTIAWPLDQGDPFETMHRHHRRVVRKAEGQVEISVREAPEALDEFAALYEATMRHRGADEFYFFSRGYWDALVGLTDAVILFGAYDDEGLAAATLCLASWPWLHYHLGATSERAREMGASALLMLSAARWGRERRFSVLHLGGGVGGSEDSLWEYKRRFAPDGRRAMRIGKAVHDAEAYLALTGADVLDLDGFFPAYRASPSASVPGARR